MITVDLQSEDVTVESLRGNVTVDAPLVGPRGRPGRDGATGEPGRDGTNGVDGTDGANGPPNILSIGTVNAGPEAAATITGTTPAQVLNLTLPTGGGGSELQRLIVNSSASLEFVDAVLTPKAPIWVSGTFSGYLTMTPLGAPGMLFDIPDRGDDPYTQLNKNVTVRYQAGGGYDFITLQAMLALAKSSDFGLPGPTRWVLAILFVFGTGGIAIGEHVLISTLG